MIDFVVIAIIVVIVALIIGLVYLVNYIRKKNLELEDW